MLTDLQLVEQLKTYYSKWKLKLNVKEALSLTSSQRRSVTNLIRDPQRSEITPIVAAKPVQLHCVSSGFSNISFPTDSLSENPTTRNVPLSSQSPQTTADGGPRLDYAQQIEMRAQQRVSAQIQKVKPVNKIRKPRTCKKCARADCSGKRRVADCKNPCRDCGEVECQGRNSRKLHLPCSTTE